MLRGIALGALLVSVAMVGASLAQSFLRPEQELDAEPYLPMIRVPVEVRVIEPVSSFEVERFYTGTINARRSSELGFERSARIVAILVEEGDLVKEGQSLARLDTRQLLVQQRRVQAQHEEAVAVLAELQAGPRPQTIAAARATVEDLESQVELQKRGYLRSRKLVREYATSVENFDQSELGLKSAEARLVASQKQLEELEAGTRVERIVAQSAVVSQLDEQLANLAIEIEDSTLVAPFDGRIAERRVDEGAVVPPAQSILRIVESGHLEAFVGLPADTLANIKRGAEFEVVVAGRAWPAVFDRALPEVDKRTQTRIAIFRLHEDAAESVVAGEIARVTLQRQMSTNGFWLPTASLIRSVRGLWAAYVVDAGPGEKVGVVQRREVEVLHTDGQRTLVRGTLVAGDRVITSGTHRVVPGQAVAIR